MPLLSCVKCPGSFPIQTNKKNRFMLLKFRENVLCPQVNFYICPKKTITTCYIYISGYWSISLSFSFLIFNVLVLLVFTKPDCFLLCVGSQIVSCVLFNGFIFSFSFSYCLILLRLVPFRCRLSSHRCFCVYVQPGLMGVCIPV